MVCGNAARLDWDRVCPVLPGDEIFCSRQPALPGRNKKQSADQKGDIAAAFGEYRVNRYVDYVSIWLVKGARYVMATGAQLGFVTTNSVCQGNHVGLLWPWIERIGAEIAFAHSSFRWSNSAKHNAGVTCVIIGLSQPDVRKSKALYEDGRMRLVAKISPYLKAATSSHVVVGASKVSISDLPPMVYGSMPRDGGHLILEPADRRAILLDHPEAIRFIRRYMGWAKLIQGIERYCLWIADEDASDAATIPPIARRLAQVRAMRRASKAPSTEGFADQPYPFVQRAHKDTPSVIIPSHSSEKTRGASDGLLGSANRHFQWRQCGVRRSPVDPRFAPVADAHDLAPGGRGAIGDAIPVLGGVGLQHVLCPALENSARERLSNHALAVLQAREEFPERTLGDLYDPAHMPGALRAAHLALDETVDQLYSPSGFEVG